MEREPLNATKFEQKYTEMQTNLDKPSKCKNCLKTNLLLVLTVAGIFVGMTVGFSVRPMRLSKDALMWLGLPGEIFMRLLKMMILPLIICSVISGTASLNPKANGKISIVAFLHCLITNFLSCMLGYIFTVIIRPARVMTSSSSRTVKTETLQTEDIFADLLRNLVPDNIVEACFRQVRTEYERVEMTGNVQTLNYNVTSGNETAISVNTVNKYLGKSDGANILGLVVVCVLIGIAINKSEGRGQVFLDFFTSATEIVLVLLRWLLWWQAITYAFSYLTHITYTVDIKRLSGRYTPIGVFSLIAVSLAAIDDVEKTFTQLGLFCLTVFAGVASHQIVVMPLILFVITRRNPYKFILSLSRAWMLAFAATSTAVAIPEMLYSCEVSNKIDKRVARFVIPFCVTLNADGSAVYITAAAFFVATVTGNPPGVSTTIIIIVLTTVAALAVPSVPSASIVTLLVILASINIPAEEIGFLFTVEWFLDRIRSTSNVVGHTSCTAVTYQFCKSDLPPLEKGKDTWNTEIVIDGPEKIYPEEIVPVSCV